MKGRKRRGQVLRVSKSQWDDASEETGRDKDTRGRGKEARETEIDSVQSERDKAIEEDQRNSRAVISSVGQRRRCH